MSTSVPFPAPMQRPAQAQPQWVCKSCGEKFGRWFVDGQWMGPSLFLSTYHVGYCHVCCRNNVVVTEARDYGYLYPWQPALPFESPHD